MCIGGGRLCRRKLNSFGHSFHFVAIVITSIVQQKGRLHMMLSLVLSVLIWMLTGSFLLGFFVFLLGLVIVIVIRILTSVLSYFLTN
jgi:hypothetical protein